jgi:hypothetical protein
MASMAQPVQVSRAMRWVPILAVLGSTVASADPALPRGPFVGLGIGIEHVSDGGDISPANGLGPAIDAEAGWWVSHWLAATGFVTAVTFGADLDNPADHLRQSDITFGARALLRLSPSLAFGPGVGVMWDHQHYTGVSTASTSRLLELSFAVVAGHVEGHAITITGRAAYAPFFGGQYPIQTLSLLLGGRL